jgi:hypothetical protein
MVRLVFATFVVALLAVMARPHALGANPTQAVNRALAVQAVGVANVVRTKQRHLVADVVRSAWRSRQ